MSMIGYFDKKIRSLLKRHLGKRCDIVLSKTLNDYIANNHLDERAAAAFKKVLNLEMNRVIEIADSSILNATIQRARYTFWVTAIVGTAIAIALTPVVALSVTLFAPIFAAFVVWGVSLATIPINYNQRVQGAMDSGIVIFENQDEKVDPAVIKRLIIQVEVQEKKIIELTEMVAQASAKNSISPQSIARGLRFWRSPEELEIITAEKVSLLSPSP
jgi:hypothetical protein